MTADPVRLSDSTLRIARAGSPINDPDIADRTAMFVELFTRNSRRIYSYILTLVPQVTDADEVYQETSKVLREKFADYQPGTQFGAWACRIAYHKALNWHKQNSRQPHAFNERFLEVLSAQHQREADYAEARQQALAQCMGELCDTDQQIIRARYHGDADIKTIAARYDKTANAIYKILSRIHRALLDCINGKMRTYESEGSL